MGNAHFRMVPAMCMAIERVAVLGAGQMGAGIAQVSACAGYEVVMIDIRQEFVDRGMGTISSSLDTLVSKGRMSEEDSASALSLISSSTDRSAASSADLVVEAIPEIPDLKFSTFSELDSICKPEAILASNLSLIHI